MSDCESDYEDDDEDEDRERPRRKTPADNEWINEGDDDREGENDMAKTTEEFVMVPRWLILGAFPAEPGASELLGFGVPNEAMLAPRSGSVTQGQVWRTWARNPVDFLDAGLGFKLTEFCYAYAFTYVYVADAEAVEILAGSDDGIAIWVNGEQVHSNNTFRGVELDSDRVPARLVKGWNRLLVKVAQGALSWGFVLRFRRPAPRGSMCFAVDRASAGKGSATSDVPLTIALAGARVMPGTPRAPWAVACTAQLFNNTGRKADKLTLSLTGADGTVLAQSRLVPLDAFASTEACHTADAGPVFAALGQGAALHLTTTSTVGSATLALGTDTVLGLFVDALAGFALPPEQGTFAVPPVFRGQPALLEVRSQHELAMAGQTIAAQPLLATRAFTARESATGTLSLKLALPAALTDPAPRLTFGDAATRELAQRLAFVLSEVRPDTTGALAPATAGLAALALDDFAGAAKALAAVMEACAAALPDRSGQSVTLVGHAHIDMNWLWTSAETRQVTHDTFRQVLAFMEEFPQFCFSQSQSSTYAYIERLDPAMFERIRERVREGRWELLGGMVDEGDTNLSSGEALARSLLLGQMYFLSRFGKAAQVGWLPDNFGHVAQLPQLLQLAGMTAFYGHRCQPKQGPYLWEGPDGSRVQCYITPTYNGEVTPKMRSMVEEFNPGGAVHIWVYGVGDHGGGPTRRDITRALSYQQLPSFPKIEFGTAAAFHKALAREAKRFPVFKGERQYVFEGCYTAIARIKEGNRRCENALFVAELLAVLARLRGAAYPKATLEAAWQTVTFNQFHDILCGSAIHASNRESVAAYDLALSQAQEVHYGALRTLAAALPTQAGRGQPVVVFNPLPTTRTDVIEAELFTYAMPPTARLGGWGGPAFPTAKLARSSVTPVDTEQPLATIFLADAAGTEIPAQIVEGRGFPQGYRMKVRFLAEDMPACGCRVFYARPDLAGAPATPGLSVNGTTVETPFLKVVVDPKTGLLTRVYDKRRKTEVLARGQAANQLKVYMEKPHGMSAWDIGPITAVHTLDVADTVKVVEYGPVRVAIEVWRHWNRSTFVQRIFVYRDVPRVEFETEVHWFEQGSPDTDAAMLRVAFPLAVRGGQFMCDTPFAVVERPTNGREVPAQKWVDLADARGGAALLNAGKYGHRCDGNTLELTLLRASYEPDPYPDQGPHTIRYALLPHAGDWQAGGVAHEGLAFNVPMPALETPPGQPGEVDADSALLTLSPENVLLSGVKQAQADDAVIVRFHETHGKKTTARLTLPAVPESVTRVDLLEAPLAGVPAPTVSGQTVRLSVRPYEIVTLKIVWPG